MKTQNSNSGLKNYSLITIVLFVISLCLVCDANSTTKTITVQDFVFTPSSVTAATGDTIKWIWIGSRIHTTTCDGIFPGTSLPPGAAAWDEPLNSGNPAFEYILTIPGTYQYVCQFHSPGMSGTIIAESPLPVELTDFVATTIKNEVILDWATGYEFNNDKFEIQRIDKNSIKGYDNNTELLYSTIGELRGYGTTELGHHYRYIDKNLRTGSYLYRLKQIDFNSNFVYHYLSDEVIIGVPSKFSISQNYPNPFNPTTKINYELPDDGYVRITLFDINGKEVSTLVNADQKAGYQTLEFNGSSISSGIYFYKIDFNNNGNAISETKRMMLIK